MVDFSKLRRARQLSVPIDPADVFLRLPKAPGFDDLWSSQADALKQWFSRRNEQDIVVKLNTGGGKTLVGLLIAQSIINERQGPVLYLCPTVQLQGQVVEQSRRYGIPAVPYMASTNQGLSEEFLGAKAVMVATYQALFNGRSKFGVADSMTTSVQLQGVILDDAHTAFSNMRDVFSLSVKRDKREALYDELTTLFRVDFAGQGRQGTYDDVVSGQESFILEVPYISWTNRSDEVRQRLAEVASTDFPFAWPLVRNSFDQCHALISKDEFVLTSFYPIVDLFPSFAECPRRIYMSATVADDSSIIRTFNAKRKSVSDPIAPTSLAGVGERMILIPDLTRLRKSETTGLAKHLATKVADSAGTVILAPSIASAKQWSDVASLAQSHEVAKAVDNLVARTTNGPYVFPNRYDGIDLPGDSCRLLILSGLPQGNNIYDLFRTTVLQGSGTISANLAQRVEQGMGRGTRGGGDHCVVILLGNDLVGWISLQSNLGLLTNTTQEQVNVGMGVSREIASVQELMGTVEQCLERSPDWTQFHADALAEATGRPNVDAGSLEVAAAERRYFALMLDGYQGKAAAVIEKFARDNAELDPKIKGWLLELGARAAHQNGEATKRDQLQREAYALNRGLLKPTSGAHYTPLMVPTQQAENIAGYMQQFALLGGALASFEQIADNFISTATARQFEEALKDLGQVLGFSCERPERKHQGAPDVLWMLNGDTAWVIECKNRKQPDNRLSKSEHGQLLQSCEWFREQYSHRAEVRVIVHPNSLATEAVTVGRTMALTLPKLWELVGSVRTLLRDLSSELRSETQLIGLCESKLDELHLRPSQIGDRYLVPFVVQGA